MSDSDLEDDDPLGWPPRRNPEKGYEGVLTPEIAMGWLTTGAPPCRDLVRRHGLKKFLFAHSRFTDAFMARDAFIREIGFAIPCKEAIETVVAGGPVVEVGAGSGFWSALVAQAGGNVRACDYPGGQDYAFQPARFMDCSPSEGAEFVRAHPNHNVLMVWPCYQKTWSAEVAKAMAPGRTLYLVSEGEGGCVGCDDLFSVIDTDFSEAAFLRIPVWPTIGDRLTVHVKNGPLSSER